MKYLKVLLIPLLLAFCSGCYRTYETPHFRIYSNMDDKYIPIIKRNAEAYYNTMISGYFDKGFERPLPIYYSKNKSDTINLLSRFGLNTDIEWAICNYHIPAVFMYHYAEDGSVAGIGTLFHEITHYFTYINFKDCPEWFSEGLSCFIGGRSRVVNGRLSVGHVNPWMERILRNGIENGEETSLEKLMSLSYNEFHNWRIGTYLARAFFHWLYKEGRLYDYMDRVKKEGYAIESLEGLLSKPREAINKELLAFIKTDSYAGAYLQDGYDLEGKPAEKEAYLKAMSIKPDYQGAQYALAQFYFDNKNYKECIKQLLPIVNDPESTWRTSATYFIGQSYLRLKRFREALKYYYSAWNNSDYCDFKQDIAYGIGRAYRDMGAKHNAYKWFKLFLQYDWEPDRHPKAGKFTKAYIKEYIRWAKN